MVLFSLPQGEGLSVSVVSFYSYGLHSDVLGSCLVPRIFESYFIVSRSRDPIEHRPSAWDFALVPQSLFGYPFELLQTFVGCGSVSARSLPTGPCLDSALDDLRALSCRFSHTRFWVRYPFLSSWSPCKDSGFLFPCSSV